MCLLRCLEALHLQTSGHLGPLSHQACSQGKSCKVDSISNVSLSLELCGLKISDVVFTKGSARNEAWWLSIFYGLCIQSFVRKVLMAMISGEPEDTENYFLSAEDHFRLAARLFTAISGDYDFLNLEPKNHDISMNRPTSDRDISRIEQIKDAAQRAVKQPTWPVLGFNCSGDFLKHIFEDEEDTSGKVQDDAGKALDSAKFAPRPKPYIPQSPDMQSYRRFRADWDIARCNYTKHAVSIGSKHGWSSKPYILLTKKWVGIEAMWKRNSKFALANTVKNGKTSLGKGTGVEQFLESQGNQCQGERFSQPLIYSSLPQDNYIRIEGDDESGRLQKQSPRYDGDLYWPPWVRGDLVSVQEGWCGMCSRWLPLNGPFQDDKDFNHGVNATTGQPFDEPMEVRQMKGDPTVWWGLCGTCEEWVELLGSKKGEVAWFVHSFGVS